MKKSIINFIFCFFNFFPFLTFSQKIFIPISDPYIVSIYTKGDKDINGNYISKDSLGNTIISGKFNGIAPEGEWIIYFKNGRKKANYFYNDGKLNGEFVEYYWNGNIKIKGVYVNNKPSLSWKTYFLDGSMESTGQMFEGKKFNEWNEYHLNGRISIISNYNKQCQLNGNYYKYDNNGRIIYSATYFQDKLDGGYKEYYLDGEVALQGNYKMGLKNGIWKISF